MQDRDGSHFCGFVCLFGGWLFGLVFVWGFFSSFFSMAIDYLFIASSERHL